MKILVTGGAGRLGRSVVSVLGDAGHHVVSVDRLDHPDPAVPNLRLDLLDEAAVEAAFAEQRPDAVVHLAAIAVPFSAPELQILTTNTRLAQVVVSAAVRAGATKVLAAGSPTVLGYGAPQGWVPQYLPVDEDHPTAPWNAYALSKQVVEGVVGVHARTTPGTVLGSFRPCFVVAPEEWDGAPTQQGHTVADRLRDPGLAAVSLFNYVDARDAGEFVLRWVEVADARVSGECFFVGAADALAVEPTAQAITATLPAAAAPAQNLERHQAAFSCAKAERLLGWRPRRTWRTELRGAPDLTAVAQTAQVAG
ncbi:NAD-dependent epimerase/dehydratase family protein [Kineococcus rhizosphaerae]|uniref:Nucleoside-diphosphate-sugar epimerase n=1 Tax=Kineococcus rhizosphaerae TaxID=559628 RepID=A0A2T0QXC6_9ACTN|nr:NAD(P)-dependent oxidoreductase [Kineococcus rhizosphaerae]PRY10538.1 nucleoside-diphosphate-sugar epimerase [Kineococcus rhizosphaerae]